MRDLIKIEKWREEFEARLLKVIGERRHPEEDPRLPEWAYVMLGRGVMLMQASSEWRPIETAPRGVSVLLCRAWDGLVSMMRVGWFDQGIWQDRSRNPLNPSHWMPLPPVPASEASSV